MKFAWTTHRHSTALQGLLPVQARPFRLAWIRTPSSSALQGPSPVQANFINARAPLPRFPVLPTRHDLGGNVSFGGWDGVLRHDLGGNVSFGGWDGVLRHDSSENVSFLGREGVLRHERGEIVSFTSWKGTGRHNLRRNVSYRVGRLGSCGERLGGGRRCALIARRWSRGDYEKDLCDLHKSILQGTDNQGFIIYVLWVGNGGAKRRARWRGGSARGRRG